MRGLFVFVVVALALSAAASSAPSAARGVAALTFTRLAGGHESVWVAAADGSHAREVTADGYDGMLSPGGRWLTFEREQVGSNPDFVLLFLVDLVRGTMRPLGESSGNERWAPIGARLAVSQPHGFFLIDADSGKRTKLLTAAVSSFDFTPDGGSIVFARGKGGGIQGRSSTERSDLFLLRLSNAALRRLTDDGHSRSPLVSTTAIAYVRFKNAYQSPEVWLMRTDGSGRRLLARCCESKWYTSHAGTIQGFETVGLSADGKRLLACQPWEGGCYPVAIDLQSGRRYVFPETRKLGTSKEGASALDLTRDGRTVLVLVHPWDDEPGPRLLYAIPFAGGKPTLLEREVVFGTWRN